MAFRTNKKNKFLTYPHPNYFDILGAVVIVNQIMVTVSNYKCAIKQPCLYVRVCIYSKSTAKRPHKVLRSSYDANKYLNSINS